MLWQPVCAVLQVIRDLLAPDKYVIVVEHDLSVLDYLSDFICCLYGKPGAYGVVTLPFSVREGINIFLAGFVPTENLRFREESLTFKVAENAGEGDDDVKKFARYTYPVMSRTQVNSPQNCVCMLFLCVSWHHFGRQIPEPPSACGVLHRFMLLLYVS